MKPFQVTDFLTSNETFELVYDVKKKAWKTSPQLAQKELATYYPKEKYTSHQAKGTDFFSKIYLWVKQRNNKTKLRLLKRHLAVGALLDYGAGNGSFALAAKQEGWAVDVFEPSANTHKQLQQLNLSQQHSLVDSSYDAITLWHVFEHLPEPEKALSAFYAALKPGGILALAVPNTDAWDTQHYGAFWAAYDVPRHLWHYNKQSICLLAADTGFHLREIRPMFWDAFYICLLSEKNKKSKSHWVKGFLKGAYSNLLGWRNKNTSALTFLLQKPK